MLKLPYDPEHAYAFFGDLLRIGYKSGERPSADFTYLMPCSMYLGSVHLKTMNLNYEVGGDVRHYFMTKRGLEVAMQSDVEYYLDMRVLSHYSDCEDA